MYVVANSKRSQNMSATTSTSSSPSTVSRWNIDPSHTTAHFGVRHLMISTVRGHFEKVSGTVTLDEADPTKSVIDVSIDASSIGTRDEKRDAHLRSADFFDVENHPTITFRSTKIVSAGKDEYKVTGDLTIRGTTKSVTLDVVGPTPPQKTPWGSFARGVSATGKINRKDFGLSWNAALETGGVVVGEEVKIEIEAELSPAS
jgi:polyisoprenoid-binding protein YceI